MEWLTQLGEYRFILSGMALVLVVVVRVYLYKKKERADREARNIKSFCNWVSGNRRR